jgi:hypothetical protein
MATLSERYQSLHFGYIFFPPLLQRFSARFKTQGQKNFFPSRHNHWAIWLVSHIGRFLLLQLAIGVRLDSRAFSSRDPTVLEVILVTWHHFCQCSSDRACDVFRPSKGKLAVYLQLA